MPPAPPPRKPTAPDADTRTRLLDAGAELFAKKGFNGCGLSEVLKHAGVPKGSFYHHFGSKEDFGVALIERTCEQFCTELQPILGDLDAAPLERLRRMFEGFREQCSTAGPEKECLIPKLALETASLSEPVHRAVQNAYRMWSELLAGPIREGQQRGEIQADGEPERLADLLVMLWEGAVLRMQIDRSVQPLDDFLGFAFDALLRPAS